MVRASTALRWLLAAIAVLVAPQIHAASEYQCGAGKPSKELKKCVCPAGTEEKTDEKAVSRCIAVMKIAKPPPPPPPPPQPAPTNCPQGMAAIPGDTFTFYDEPVTVLPFCIDLKETTVKDYRDCVNAGVCTLPKAHSAKETDSLGGIPRSSCNWLHPDGRDLHPINCVEREWAQAYCHYRQRRLPSTQEWEWAARGGTKATTYPWGNEDPTPARANGCGPKCMEYLVSRGTGTYTKDQTPLYAKDDGFVDTAPVGSFPAGNFGLYDMAGNVREWSQFGIRGGSWSASAKVSFAVSTDGTGGTSALIGFRCARSAYP